MRRTLALLVAAIALAACASTSEEGDGGGGGSRARPVLVTRVVDGDTAEISIDGREIDVRFIGIDTPETVAPGQPVECFGPQASAYTERRLEDRTVRLEYDVERIDQYGRTLAYVWIGDELFNETLVTQGYALVTTYPPDVKYVDRFVAAQREAREAGRGLWSACPG
jgi:micrococcal nuclease